MWNCLVVRGSLFNRISGWKYGTVCRECRTLQSKALVKNVEFDLKIINHL